MVQNIKCECENTRRAVTPQRQPLQQKEENLLQTASKKRQDEEKKKQTLSGKLLSITAGPLFSPSKSSIILNNNKKY